MNKLQTEKHNYRHKLIREKEFELREMIIKGFHPSKGTINDLITREDSKHARDLFEQFIEGIFWDMESAKQTIIDNYNQGFKNSLVGVTYKELHDWNKRVSSQ